MARPPPRPRRSRACSTPRRWRGSRPSCDEAYNKLILVMQGNLEASLSDIETTLSNLKVEMAKSDAEKKEYLTMMEDLENKLSSVNQIINPVKEKLNEVLNGNETAAAPEAA